MLNHFSGDMAGLLQGCASAHPSPYGGREKDMNAREDEVRIGRDDEIEISAVMPAPRHPRRPHTAAIARVTPAAANAGETPFVHAAGVDREQAGLPCRVAILR
jgi:hypothetical protein